MHFLLLLLWLIIGISLRFGNLTGKPPWIDEFATMVFSLGNTFQSVPINQAISVDTLLQPLQLNSGVGVGDVIRNLVTQDTHPPLYFVLSHLWIKLFPTEFGLVSLFAARSLPALFGAASIPLAYCLGKLAFRSSLSGHLAAAMMAVSPYGIYIAQEARHYSLAILWVIASFGCLVIATRHIQHNKPLPISVILSWITINFLGISTHYFFALTLGTEVCWLTVLAWRNRKKGQFSSLWWQVSAVAIGTIISCSIWLPLFLQNRNSGELTKWIQSGDRSFLEWINPIFQALGVWISMLYLLPVSVPSLPVIIISGLGMLLFLIWLIPILKLGLKKSLAQPTTSLMTQMFAVLVAGAFLLFFFFAYVLGIDITRGARYYFVFFPAVTVLLTPILAVTWKIPQQKKWKQTGKPAVAIIWLMGLVSSLVVATNLGYPKYYRPDLLVPVIQQISTNPILIAATHRSLISTGEMMGLAREFKLKQATQKDKTLGNSTTPLFLLAHQDQNPNTANATLQKTLQALPRPLDLWLVNFKENAVINNCTVDTKPAIGVDGYETKLYHC
ncbi:MAG: glycosyltransferase [Scytonematopsis contorta HA4267-MV1]|jgi:uncharacterized membrane protein|nr:glycosyltransferase [Scytonematopsis contorta HA4267-MV1]